MPLSAWAAVFRVSGELMAVTRLGSTNLWRCGLQVFFLLRPGPISAQRHCCCAITSPWREDLCSKALKQS